MYEYTPKKDNKTVILVSGLSFLSGAGLFLLAAGIMKNVYPIIWQICGIVFFVVGIQLFTRYFTKTYSYVIDKDPVSYFEEELNRMGQPASDDGLYLKFVCTYGKNSKIVGGVPLTAIVECKKGSPKELKEYSSSKYNFNYCNKMFSKEKHSLYCMINGEGVVVEFEPDETILNFIF